MRYQELDTYWKRIFELEWISLCEGSKAIAALIVSDDGTIISEGRNKNPGESGDDYGNDYSCGRYDVSAL